jgi:hypothetical protein
MAAARQQVPQTSCEAGETTNIMPWGIVSLKDHIAAAN